jgi:hypothetical protein
VCTALLLGLYQAISAVRSMCMSRLMIRFAWHFILGKAKGWVFGGHSQNVQARYNYRPVLGPLLWELPHPVALPPYLIYKFTTSVRLWRSSGVQVRPTGPGPALPDLHMGARVRHRRTTGPGPAKTGEGLTGCDGGQHGRAGVPSPNAQASKTRTIKKNLARAQRRPGVWNRGSKY